MTDRAYDPADANPFDQFDPDKVGASPANQNNKKQDDPFEEFNPFPGQGIKPQADQSSTVGAFARGAERSAIPAIGSLPAIGAGAEIGAGLGALTGPFAPIGVPVGGLIGGVIGGFTGGYALSQAQNYVLSKAPDSWKEKIGLDDRQEKLDEAEHPYASFLGGLTPYALTMRPGAVPTTKLPENATALQRILAHPATARVFGGAAMGGMELGQEAAGGQSPDWTKVAVSTGFGLVFNTPTRIGESLTELGARPTRTLLGQPQPVPAATAPPASEKPTEAPQEAPAPAPARPAPAEGIAPTLFHAPTVAQANDLGVMGPGATEQTFLGAHERNPDAAMTAQEAARTEQSMTQTTPSLPDIHEVARRMDPDLFDQYEEINQRRNTLQEWISSEGAENAPVAVGHLATLNGELSELEPKVAAAYRRAAEASGHPTVEPQPVSESWGLFPPPEVRAPPSIDTTHTVVSGANSSREAGGPVYVDPEIPAVSPTLKTSAGEPAPLRKYVAIHEDAERNEMLRFEAAFKEANGREPTKDEWNDHYNNFAHPKVATPAERAAVEADGVNWNDYTHEMDGFLAHIEHKPNSNPPPNTITDPEADIGHHKSENKPVAETGILGTAPRSIEAQKQFIAADVAKQLAAAGRPQEEAEAAGKLVAARYEARAARMGGRLGTAQELYEREGAQIRGPRGAAPAGAGGAPEAAPTPGAEAIPESEITTTHVGPKAARGPRAVPQERWSLLQFLTDKGGIRPDDKNIGDVRQSFGGKNHFEPGFGQLIRPGGMTLDRAREAAVEAGYIQDLGQTGVKSGEATSNLDTLLQAIDKESRGTRVYRQGIQPADARVREIDEAEAERDRAEQAATTKEIDDYLKDTDQKASEIAPDVMARMREIVSRQRIDPSVAHERAVMEVRNDAIEKGNSPDFLDEIPGWTIPDDAGATQGGSENAPQGQEAAPGARSRTNREGDREKAWTEFYQRVGRQEDYEKAKATRDSIDEENKRAAAAMNEFPRGAMGLTPDSVKATPEWKAAKAASDRAFQKLRNFNEAFNKAFPDEIKAERMARNAAREAAVAPKVEPGAEGKPQTVLPGAERITDAELAQRRVNEPLKPTAEQKPMDVGLFGDEKDQKELFQRKRYTRDELERMDIDDLDRMAYGHADGETVTLQPDQIKIKYPGDLENPQDKFDKQGMPWVRSVDRSTPVDVSIGQDGQFYLEDGHHRWFAAQKLGEPVTATIERITGKPIETILQRQDSELEQATRGGIVLNPNAVPGHDYIGMENVKPLLRITSEGNASTFIHESGHQYLAELVRDAGHEAAPADLKADAQTIADWLGLKSPEDLKLAPDAPRAAKVAATKAHEKFARGFEQYLREGVAPSQELAGVFAKFKNWLLGIYRTIKGLGSPINDDVKRVFDRLLTTEPQKTVIAPEREVRPTLADIHTVDARETPPVEAEPRGDLVNSEADRYIAEHQPEIAHEAQTEAAKIQAERSPAGEAPDAATEARPGEPGPAALGASGGQPESVPGGGGVGEGRGAVEAGGGGPVHEGNELPGGERGPEPSNLARDQPLAPSPATTFGPRESPFLDKAGNIRLENLTNDHDVREAIRDAALENDDFIGDRRGVVTDGQVADLASDLGMEGAEALVKKKIIGQAYNAEQVWALRKLLIQSATEVSAAMKQAAIGTDEDLMAYAIAKDRHQLIQATVAQATAEAGRALRAFRTMAGEENAQATNEFIKSATGKTLFQLKMEAKLGAQLDSPGKISKFLNDARDRSFGGMVLEYWINGLISGVATHVTYVQGNIILALEKAGPETAIAAALGAAQRARGRPGEVVHIGEVGAQLKGAIRGLPGAAEAFLEAMRSGQTTLLPGEQARPLMPFSGDSVLTVAKSMTDDPVKWREVGAQAFSMIRGIRDGFVAGAALLRAGGIEGAPLIGAQYSSLGQIPDIAVRGVPVLPLGSTIRVPGRSVAAIHSFFRSLNYSMNKSAEAFRTASEEGLTGNAFASRVGDIWQNPTPEIMERSRETATQLTLMGQGGEFVKALGHLTNATVDLPVIGKIAPLKFIDPFVHIGANIIKQAIVERTPVGILSPEIRADLMGKNGNIAQDMAQARMIAGTSMALLFGGLAMEGYASGSGPSDPHQSAMWRLAGNQAHSVRIGDIWYQVNRLGPMGMLMSTAADFYDVAHEASQGDILMAASHIQHAITQNILDESFMRGPADLIKAIEDPGRYGEGYIRNFLSSFVPFSVGMAQMARASDPYSRQARTVMDSIKAKVPGLSETLLPRRDIWGEELPSYDALGHAGLTAIYETRVSRDPVNQAMLQLGISPAQPIRKIRNVDLTDQQYDDYSRISGRMTKMRLDAIVRSPDWQTWPNHIKHDVISEVIRQSREAAVGTMMMKYPQIVSDATAAKMKKQQD